MDERVKATKAVWYSMIRRCENPKDNSYHRYGGRGISVCNRWRGEDGFNNFLSDMGTRPPGLGKDKWTLDRIDGDQGYSPENCRWADMTTQNNDPKRLRRVSIAIKKVWQDEDYRAAQSERMIGNQVTLGYRHTEQAKAKIAEASRQRATTDEKRRKISALKKGNTYNVGRVHSEEARRNMAAAKRREWADPEIRARRIAAIRKAKGLEP